ncbi:hypothetical protein BH23GEM9_BH23GEM9_30340 [soil metagenome]
MENLPHAAIVIWWVTLALAYLVFVPLAVHLLHRTWRAARNIQRYATDLRVTAGGVAGGTGNIQSLAATVDTAGGILAAAGSVAGRLDTIATVLAARAEGV